MSIKKTIKKSGKGFIILRQEAKDMGGQSALMVDNGYAWIGHLCRAIEKTYDYFPEADISVLTSDNRKVKLEKDFPKLKFIALSERMRPKKYKIALQMLMMRQKRYNYVVLFSLDIMPLLVSLFFFGRIIVLYNQWGQWWSLRLRDITQVFKVTYVKKRTRGGLKNIIKNIGLFFVLVQRRDDVLFRRSVLVVDDGYAGFDQINYCIQRIKKFFPASAISVLASGEREDLVRNLQGVEIITAADFFIKDLAVACHMCRLNKKGYDYIVIISLDIMPIIISSFFVKTGILLFNRWGQWWSLKPKPIRLQLALIPEFFFNVIISAYLLVSVFWIFVKRSFNMYKKGLSWKST